MKDFTPLLEAIQREHERLIRDYRYYWIRKVIFMLLPYLVGGLQWYYCKSYLYPRGEISDMHYYGEYEAWTLVESEFTYYMGQFLTAVFVYMTMREFVSTFETAVYYNGEHKETFTVIGQVPTSFGVVLCGPRLYQKTVVEPRQYKNFDGLTFTNPDQAALIAVGEHLRRKDFIFESIYNRSRSTGVIKSPQDQDQDQEQEIIVS